MLSFEGDSPSHVIRMGEVPHREFGLQSSESPHLTKFFKKNYQAVDLCNCLFYSMFAQLIVAHWLNCVNRLIWDEKLKACLSCVWPTSRRVLFCLEIFPEWHRHRSGTPLLDPNHLSWSGFVCLCTFPCRTCFSFTNWSSRLLIKIILSEFRFTRLLLSSLHRCLHARVPCLARWYMNPSLWQCMWPSGGLDPNPSHGRVTNVEFESSTDIPTLLCWIVVNKPWFDLDSTLT